MPSGEGVLIRDREGRNKIAELASGREEPGSMGSGAHGLGAVGGMSMGAMLWFCSDTHAREPKAPGRVP